MRTYGNCDCADYNVFNDFHHVFRKKTANGDAHHQSNMEKEGKPRKGKREQTTHKAGIHRLELVDRDHESERYRYTDVTIFSLTL